MEFKERPSDPEHRCEMRFTYEEAEVIRAVYLEMINNSAENGNTTVSDFDWDMCVYGEGPNEPSWRKFVKPEGLIEKLDDFHDRTDEAITDIALGDSMPAHANWHTYERNLLGKRACDLAREIESHLPSDGPIEIPKLEETPNHFPEDWTKN